MASYEPNHTHFIAHSHPAGWMTGKALAIPAVHQTW
jgi:hypothetical protein